MEVGGNFVVIFRDEKPMTMQFIAKILHRILNLLLHFTMATLVDCQKLSSFENVEIELIKVYEISQSVQSRIALQLHSI